MYRRRALRARLGLCGLIQIHHIIPRQWATHPVVAASMYEMDDARNLMFMPTECARDVMWLRSDRLFHSKGHANYNLYVKQCLDDIDIGDASAIHELADRMRHALRFNPSTVPWN